jgi:hypothetical protein
MFVLESLIAMSLLGALVITVKIPIKIWIYVQVPCRGSGHRPCIG